MKIDEMVETIDGAKAETATTARKWVRVDQGLAIAEFDNGRYLLMFPNGDVDHAATKAKALAKMKRWFARDLKARGADIGLAVLRWQ